MSDETSLSQAQRKRIRQLHHRRGRAKARAFLAEGIRCCQELVDAQVEIRLALVSPRVQELAGGNGLLLALQQRGVSCVCLDEADIGELTATRTPQGVMLVCSMPAELPATPDPDRVLVLDAIQDPGNVGTLLRSATAFDVDRVLLLDGCADPYGPKAVRASAGTVGRVRPVSMHADHAVAALAGWGLPLLVADPAGTPCRALRLERWAVAIGNEGTGVRPQLRGAATELVAIPMRRDVESLNAAVAGSILMFSLRTIGGP